MNNLLSRNLLSAILLLSLQMICTNAYAPPSEGTAPALNSEIETVEYPHTIENNTNLYTELLAQGFSSADIHQFLKLSKPYYDLSKIPRGLRYRLIYANQPILSWGGIEFQLTSTKRLRFTLNQEAQWTVHFKELKVQTRVVSFVGTVRNSLWESARLAHMSPQLIANLTEIFAWEIDFSRQVSENDSWRLTVEQQFMNGRPVGWGRILAAEYRTQSNSYQAVFFEKKGMVTGYFDLKGHSLAKSFLRSPIEFARISSGFSLRRFHPKLGIFRPHLGVDYAAPRGTPVRALGNGTILDASYSTSGGKTLSVAHGNLYKTRYLHLNSFASKIRPGTLVKQGQVIGFVGSTGLSTGPHLHFEFYQNGHYMDPLKLDLPASESIPIALWTEFETHSTQRLSQLPPLPRNVASN